jgi:tetratricopeptide (TPR) repeat protein
MCAAAKPTVFISYSHKDEEWKDRLVTHLGSLHYEGLLNTWDDRSFGVGEDWYEHIQAAMNAANVAILLISANFLTSEFMLHKEVPSLLQHRDKQGMTIFPIIVKSCPWKAVNWISNMQVRPKDGKPLTSYSGNQIDEVLSNIATEVYKQVNLTSKLFVRQAKVSLDSQKISISRLPVTGRDLFGREKELQQLDDAWANQKTHILSLVAWGGVGKSALVNHWLGRMASDDYRGAERVYAWSFYSQGTTDRAVSADQFIEAALIFFGDPDPNKGSPWDKGERLAQLVGSQRTLLVLDGLEPLQHPPGADEGRLKDQALHSLLRGLAASSKGLCLISTRVAVTDLSAFENSTAPRIDLEHLSPEAGAQVLTAQGVQGTQAELEQASIEFGGHSLALTLLGSYLGDVYGGDINRRKEVSDLEGDVRYGGHAQKVMASHEKWFGEGPELSVLRVLGLFNRPADKDAIAALRSAPAIVGLTDALQGLSEPKWQQVLSRLRRAKLLAAPSPNQPGMLDTHPIVREHFGQQLKRTRPEAWREGNNRLYEHLKRTTKVFPDTLEEMAPLYMAIAHGCAADRHHEVLNEVYLQRIQRGNEYFSTHRLGAFSADLASLSSFFAIPWSKPVAGISVPEKVFILSTAGFYLLALGQLAEAVKPMQAGLEQALALQDYSNAARASGNLSELFSTIGDLANASTYAQQSVGLADRAGNAVLRSVSKAILASVLHQQGNILESENIFSVAERIQFEQQPHFPFLYSLAGFRYCQLLLEMGKYQEVLSRASKLIELHQQYASLFDLALDHLLLGQTHLLQVQHNNEGDFILATHYVEKAVGMLRQAGRLDYLPLGLLTKAKVRRVTNNLEAARANLDEAFAIASRDNMGLRQADCHLEYAWLYLVQGKKDEANEHYVIARTMIGRIGYHRRDRELADLYQSFLNV